MVPGDARYIHGTAAEEQRRLSRLNGMLNETSLAAMRLEGGERVLDVGCGLGQLTRMIARAVGPGGRVIGVDRSAEQLDEARRQSQEQNEAELVELRLGELPRLPLSNAEAGSFDLVHARFVLEHVAEPVRVVEAMLDAARPGGRLILEDDDHDLIRTHPACGAFERLWRMYMRTYERLGCDPLVGRRLVSLLHQAGARPTRNDYLFFGGCAGSPDFDAMVGNFAGVLETARPRLLETTELDAASLDAGLAELHRWSRRPDAALWYARCWAEGTRPATEEA